MDSPPLDVASKSMSWLLHSVEHGNFRIPQFQRDLVWEPNKVVKLFDSIRRGFPIGSVLLWRAPKDYQALIRNNVALTTAPMDPDEPVTFILDGQQRITSLYATLRGLTLPRGGGSRNYRHVCFDFVGNEFVFRPSDGERYLAVADLVDMSKLKTFLKNPHVEEAFDLSRQINAYPLSVITVQAKTLEDVCEIFQRVNQGGKRLDRFDLIVSNTFSREFDLRAQFRRDIEEPLLRSKFLARKDEIAPTVATQLIALLKSGACTEKAEFELTGADVARLWPDAAKAIALAVDTMRGDFGVVRYAYLPYDAQLTLAAYFFAKSGSRTPSADQLVWLKTWFWRTSFGQHYSSAVATRMSQDAKAFDELASQGRADPFPTTLTLDAAALTRTKMTQATSAVRNAFLCLLANRRPVDLSSNAEIHLRGDEMSEFVSPEKHHLFPRAFLVRGGESGGLHALPNFCFLTAALNKRISDRTPSEYWPELARENPTLGAAAAAQLVPVGPHSGIEQNDYATFLAARANAILDEVRRITGLSSAPTADERRDRIAELEVRMRDAIHDVLTTTVGAAYWKSLPGDVFDGVNKKIEQEASRHAGLKDTLQNPRRRLDFCDVMDYFKIISTGPQWATFREVFSNQEDFRKRMNALTKYRNALAHSRVPTQVDQLEGDAALIWLTEALDTLESGSGEEQEDEAAA